MKKRFYNWGLILSASFLIFIFLSYVMGCTYYKTKYKPIESYGNQTFNNYNPLQQKAIHIIVHTAMGEYSLSEAVFDSVCVSGNLTKPIKKIYYHDLKNNRYKTDEKRILREVHIYVNDDSEINLKEGQNTILYKDVKGLKVIEPDKELTIAVAVLSVLGGGIAIAVLIGIIIMLTKSSCPFVYAFDGDQYNFVGEIYGGAIAKNLVRDDYLPLPQTKSNDTYKIKISNMLKEVQHTDMTQLIAIKHSKQYKVLIDKQGTPHTYQYLQSPYKAVSLSGQNLRPFIQAKDSLKYLFNDEDYSENNITLSFKKESAQTQANLVICAQNSLWFDYIFGEFLSKFGNRYNTWMEKQNTLPQKLREQRMLEHKFPLFIYLKQQNDWKLIEYLPTIGPLAERKFIIPIDLSLVSTSEFEIKIESGFMFWELNSVGISYNNTAKLSVDYILPSSAWGNDNIDYTETLNKTDGNYMVQENVGDVTEIVYDISQLTTDDDKTYSYFLYCNGYYELIRDFKGKPKIEELTKFKAPGYFSEFSRAEYLKANQQVIHLAAKNN